MTNFDRYITIPEYYQRFCDNSVNLETVRNIPCKFHDEKHGKSFTYSPSKRIWRCWGECHCGGDVVELHKLNYRLKTRSDAEKSLAAILGIELEKPKLERKNYSVDDAKVHYNRILSKALRKAKDVEAWLELDYIMSQYPPDIKQLEIFCDTH